MPYVVPNFVEYNGELALVLKEYKGLDNKGNTVDTHYDLYVFSSPSQVVKGVNGLTLFGELVPYVEPNSFNDESEGNEGDSE